MVLERGIEQTFYNDKTLKILEDILTNPNTASFYFEILMKLAKDNLKALADTWDKDGRISSATFVIGGDGDGRPERVILGRERSRIEGRNLQERRIDEPLVVPEGEVDTNDPCLHTASGKISLLDIV